MAIKLGELLITQDLITRDQLMQALQAQGQFGGRLGTNLVELGFLTEEQLAKSLSDQLNVPYVNSSGVANIAPEVIKKISVNLAKEYRVVPLRYENRILHVCMSDPMNLQKIDELGFHLNCSVKASVITEVALNYALERYYGIARDTRFFKVTEAGVGVTQSTEFIQLSDGSGQGSGSSQMDRADFLQVKQDVTFKKSGTDTLPDFSNLLIHIQGTDQLLGLLGKFVEALFSKTVFFRLQKGQVVGLAAFGVPIKPEQIKNLVYPVVEGELFHEVLESVRVVYRENVEDPTLVNICQKIGMIPQWVTLFPVLEDRRMVLIGMGQGLAAEKLKLLFPRFKRFLSQVSCALQILALQKEIQRLATKDQDI